MFGVLVDVSASMCSAYAASENLQDDESVSRMHALFTTVAKIVEREVAHHERQDSIFACAFGLRKQYPPVCNLIELFTKLRDFNASLQKPATCGHDELVELAKQNGKGEVEHWIREHLEDKEASLLNWLLRNDESLIPELLDKLPSKFLRNAAKLKCQVIGQVHAILRRRPPRELPSPAELSPGDKFIIELKEKQKAMGLVPKASPPQSPCGTRPLSPSSPPSFPPPSPPPPSPPSSPVTAHSLERQTFKSSAAYAHAQKIMSDKYMYAFSKILNKPIEPRSVQYVSQLMKELITGPVLNKPAASASSSQKHDHIKELVDQIKPFIYAQTPMCKAMNEAVSIFKQVDTDMYKVLFIVSDGKSTDGDPRPIAQELHAMGVRIITCYLTSDHINNTRSLLDEADPTWENGQQVLFKMSSTMKNTHTPISYLVDVGWELPPSGESHLFVQANSLNVVNELCEIVVSQMTKDCDALVDIIEKVPLATYINQQNVDFIPREQVGGTCYANAIATTFHLSMHRIVGREGGIPDFDTIRDRIICKYGQDGASTKQVLEEVCPEYRLQFRKVSETGARKAINQRRPVVAIFELYSKQWNKFFEFFRKTNKDILKRTDLQTSE